ncbi:MAG: class II aldolase/adducin family protein [Alphaproteobacteria bacterium]|nr:class II aldolase/adducin family protein [Alphaproteobacteria bacterium]
MSVRVVTTNSRVRDQVSEAEWKTRVDLAAAHRLLAHYGVQDLTYNHLSARVPDAPEHILIKPYAAMFEEVTASSLLKYDLEGKPVGGDYPNLIGGGLVIHAGMLNARRDVSAVFHTHTVANMGVSSQKHGLLPINQHAMRFYKQIVYHDFKGFEFDYAMRGVLEKDLGDKMVMMLRNHGVLVCGRSIAEAFVLHHFLETACRGQIAALSAGIDNIVLPDEAACEYARKQAEENAANLAGGKDWPACLRLAERLDPSFRE